MPRRPVPTLDRTMDLVAEEHAVAALELLEFLDREMDDLDRRNAGAIGDVADNYRQSARNLVDYVALRRHDLQELQLELAKLGLSSLGRCESWVRSNIDAVRHALRALSGLPSTEPPCCGGRVSLDEGKQLIESNARRLLGEAAERKVRIMVTLPEEAADHPTMMRDLLRAGMNCLRINCAHGDPALWERALHKLSIARLEENRSCNVCMDLEGPNPRTVLPKDGRQRRLFEGDAILLTAVDTGGKAAAPDAPAQLCCTHPEIVSDLKTGERVFIDDGKIGALVEETDGDCALLRVVRASPKGKKLRAEKGLNVPDTDLRLSSLTDRDLEVLPFVAGHADMVGYSFVRRPADVSRLQDELARCGGERLGIILKIETVPAFRHFPRLLLTAMRSRKVGVMIARGDMAIESGYERLAEIQEEILWFCEAAHLPVVWATGVLQSYVKTGIPERGEITDAAMGGRAECVMLNKGAFIVEAVASLADILKRMEDHQLKKRSLFRRLSVSESFLDEKAL